MGSRNQIPEPLRRFVVADPGEAGDTTIIDVTEAAARLEEPPEAVESYIQQKRLLAWKISRGMRIPAEQILGPHRIVPGLAQVLETIPDARSAWNFIALESPFFPGEPQRPLEVLKAGQLEDVIRASIAHGEAFT